MTAASCVACPNCGGRRHNAVFVHAGTGSHFEPQMRCSYCSGSGRITAEQADWWKRGKALRNARIARQESLREMARRLGLSPADASAMENGRADPAPLERGEAEGGEHG